MSDAPVLGAKRELVVCAEVTRTQITQYAGASGDFSPLHTDEPAARRTGQPSIMAHGMMTMALSGRVVTEWFGTAALRSLSSRFTAPVWPGDRLVSIAEVSGVTEGPNGSTVELRLVTSNQDGRVVLTGDARVFIDSDSNSK